MIHADYSTGLYPSVEGPLCKNNDFSCFFFALQLRLHRLTVDSSWSNTSITLSPVHGSSGEPIQIIQSWQCCCCWRLSDTIYWNYSTSVRSLMETHRGRCRHATSHHNDTVATGSTLQLAGEGEGSCSIWKHDWRLGCGILALYTLAWRRERTDMNGNTNTAPPSVWRVSTLWFDLWWPQLAPHYKQQRNMNSSRGGLTLVTLICHYIWASPPALRLRPYRLSHRSAAGGQNLQRLCHHH